MKLIAVGSTNPVKIDATRRAVRLIWDEIKVESVEVDSEVSEQPTSDREAIAGASNRAKKAKQALDADFGVGLEGSTMEINDKVFVTGWSVVINDTGEEMVGGGGRVQLPRKVVMKIREGNELGEVMSKLCGQAKVNEKEGAIGVLTNGLIDRTQAYYEAIIFSLAKILAPRFYDNPN